MDDEGWEKAKKQKLDADAVVVADDDDGILMDLADDSDGISMDYGDSSPAMPSVDSWSWLPASAFWTSSSWVPFPEREDEKEKYDVGMKTSNFWDCESSSDDDDDRRKPRDEAEDQKLETELLGILKKVQRASLDMYDRLEKEFKGSSEEWKCKDWKERVDRVRTILKEDPEFCMWEHWEYWDLMLVVDYCDFKSPYHCLIANRIPETGNLVSSIFYSNAHGDDKERDEQRVGLQKEIEKSNLAKENPDPNTVLSKAQDIAKPFNLLRLKDVRRAVDDYLRKESCKRDLVILRDLLKALKKDSGKRDVIPKISAISAICDRALPYCLFGDDLSLLRRLESLEDDEAMREIDNEYEKHLNVFENTEIFYRADYLSLKLRFAKEFGF